MIALSAAKPGKIYTIKWNVSNLSYLNECGLNQGNDIYLASSFWGNTIIIVNNKRIALDSSTSFGIKV